MSDFTIFTLFPQEIRLDVYDMAAEDGGYVDAEEIELESGDRMMMLHKTDRHNLMEAIPEARRYFKRRGVELMFAIRPVSNVHRGHSGIWMHARYDLIHVGLDSSAPTSSLDFQACLVTPRDTMFVRRVTVTVDSLTNNIQYLVANARGALMLERLTIDVGTMFSNFQSPVTATLKFGQDMEFPGIFIPTLYMAGMVYLGMPALTALGYMATNPVDRQAFADFWMRMNRILAAPPSPFWLPEVWIFVSFTPVPIAPALPAVPPVAAMTIIDLTEDADNEVDDAVYSGESDYDGDDDETVYSGGSIYDSSDFVAEFVDGDGEDFEDENESTENHVRSS